MFRSRIIHGPIPRIDLLKFILLMFMFCDAPRQHEIEVDERERGEEVFQQEKRAGLPNQCWSESAINRDSKNEEWHILKYHSHAGPAWKYIVNAFQSKVNRNMFLY